MAMIEKVAAVGGWVRVVLVLVVPVLAVGGSGVGGGGGSGPVDAVFAGPSGAVEGLFPTELFGGWFEDRGAGFEVVMDPVFNDSQPDWSAEEADAVGHFMLELRDRAGSVVRQVPFDASQAWRNEDGSVDGFFGFWLYRAPVYDSYAIYKDGQELLAVQRSPNPPTAAISGVSEGQRFGHDDTIELQLELRDTDGDELVYFLYYSPDITQGYERLIDSRSYRDTTVTLKAGSLRGSEQARFAVSVSDGARATFVESPAFEVARHTPVVKIQAPESGYRFLGGQWATLKAHVEDIDDFADSRGTYGTVVWESDLDGIIEPSRGGDQGSLQTLQLYTPRLSEGDHTLTLTVTDTTGRTGSHSVPMQILHKSYNPPEPPPFQAKYDNADTQTGHTTHIDILTNDILSFDVGSPRFDDNSRPELGEAEIIHDPDGYPMVAYTAHAPGEDHFRYIVCAEEDPSHCTSARVHVTVSPAE